MNIITNLQLKAIIVLFVSLLLTGCGLFEVNMSVEHIDPSTTTPVHVVATFTSTSIAMPATVTSSQAVTPTPVETAPPEGAGTETAMQESFVSLPPLDALYHDTYSGITLNYPANWERTEFSDARKAQSSNYSTSFRSWIAGPGGGGGIPDGETKFDLSVRFDSAPTLEEALATRRQEIMQPSSEMTLLAKEEITLDSGVPAVRLRTESKFGESAEILTMINGHMVIFGGIGDQALLGKIVHTLRALTSEEADFNPYPVRATDVRAIQLAQGVDRVPIYSGPGEFFIQAAMLEAGTALAVSGITEDRRWYKLTGCGSHNPYRPAPTCWISADQRVSLPIRGFGPSLEQVMPTTKMAVQVISGDFTIPLYSGPAEHYPVVSYLASGFSFPIIGVSQDSNWWHLDSCSSPLGEPLYECWASAAPSVTQGLDELIPHGPQSSAPQPIEAPLRSGTITITELPRCFNLDLGTVGSQSNLNCEFNLRPHETASTLMFEPIPPSRFGFSGIFPEVPTETTCVESQHLSGSVEVIAPAASLYTCYQTGEGRFGYLRFLEMTDSPLTVTLAWQTFDR